MTRDRVFAGTAAPPGEFEFNAAVAEVFDDMLVRSIPLYLEQQAMVRQLAKTFWTPCTDVYDLGCSTGTTLIELCREIGGPARFVGYDKSVPMLERAEAKIEAAGLQGCVEVCRADFEGDLSSLPLHNAGVVTMCWTLQFTRPALRDGVVRWIYDGLVEGGVLIVAEKVLTNSPRMNEPFADLYYAYKRRNAYSDEEIVRKRAALENVLVPFRIADNVELFRRNGFAIVETFFQWFNFAGFLCVKQARPRPTSPVVGSSSLSTISTA